MAQQSNAEEEVVIDIDKSVAAMQRRLEKRREEISTGFGTSKSEICIYRVPQSLVGISPKAIRPEMVSIGPYHHSQEYDEDYKMKYLDAFLSRKKQDLYHFFRLARDLEAEARRCYDDKKIDMSSEEFVAMMVLDGCFIIELFLQDEDGAFKDVEEKDRLVMDLLKLENQLPFFVLERLYDPAKTRRHLAHVARNFLEPSIPVAVNFVTSHQDVKDVKHLLDLFHSSLVIPSDNTPDQQHQHQLSFIAMRSVNLFIDAVQETQQCGQCLSTLFDHPAKVIRYFLAIPLLFGWWILAFLYGLLVSVYSILVFFVWWSVDNVKRILEPTTGLEYRPSSESIQCTTQLRPSGIKFKPLRDADSFLTIQYQKRVLQIPPITINDVTITIFINSIAFEQCCPHKTRSSLTTYIAFMSCLINTSRDVALLSDDGIITTSFSHNDHGIAELFNKLGKTVYFDKKDCYLSKQFKDVEAYYNSHWGTFLRTYFSAPWSFISVVTACILLVLAVGQTVLSILSYIKPMSDKEK